MSLPPESAKQSCLFYDPEIQAAVLLAERDYAPGEEVYDSYGVNLMPQELLVSYGFVDLPKLMDTDAYGVAVPSKAVGTGGGGGRVRGMVRSDWTCKLCTRKGHSFSLGYGRGQTPSRGQKGRVEMAPEGAPATAVDKVLTRQQG